MPQPKTDTVVIEDSSIDPAAVKKLAKLAAAMAVTTAVAIGATVLVMKKLESGEE